MIRNWQSTSPGVVSAPIAIRGSTSASVLSVLVTGPDGGSIGPAPSAPQSTSDAPPQITPARLGSVCMPDSPRLIVR